MPTAVIVTHLGLAARSTPAFLTGANTAVKMAFTVPTALLRGRQIARCSSHRADRALAGKATVVAIAHALVGHTRTLGTTHLTICRGACLGGARVTHEAPAFFVAHTLAFAFARARTMSAAVILAGSGLASCTNKTRLADTLSLNTLSIVRPSTFLVVEIRACQALAASAGPIACARAVARMAHTVTRAVVRACLHLTENAPIPIFTGTLHITCGAVDALPTSVTIFWGINVARAP